MHLLNIEQSGALYDSAEAIDLDIPAGDIVCLSSADTDIALLAYAARRYADAVPIDGVLHLPARLIGQRYDWQITFRYHIPIQ